MKLLKEKIGLSVKVPKLNKFITVNEKNKGVLLAFGMFDFFEPDKELEPIKKKGRKKPTKKTDTNVSKNIDKGHGERDRGDSDGESDSK